MKTTREVFLIGLLLLSTGNLRAWHTFLADTHEQIAFDSLRTIPATGTPEVPGYPDLHRYSGQLQTGSDTEAHNTAWNRTDNANVLNGGFPKAWWDDGIDVNGNEDNALYYYKNFNFGQAYDYIGRILHLIQDQGVPAHGANIFHHSTVWDPYGDNLEKAARSHYLYPGVSSQKFAGEPLSGYYTDLQNLTFSKVAQSDADSTSSWRLSSENAYWLTDDYDTAADDATKDPSRMVGWGSYGGGIPGNRTDIYDWSISPGILNTQIGDSIKFAGGAMMTASELLPPLVRNQLTISAPIINTETGNNISFKIIENRTQKVKISLVVAETGQFIKDSSGKIWNKSEEVLGEDSELPFGKIFNNINFKGEISSGNPLPDGNYTLRVLVWDTEGVPNQAPTNLTDPTGVASVNFTISRSPVISTFTVSSVINGPDGGGISFTVMADSPDIRCDMYVRDTTQTVRTGEMAVELGNTETADGVEGYDYQDGSFIWSNLGQSLYATNPTVSGLLAYKANFSAHWYGSVSGDDLPAREAPYTLVVRITDHAGRTQEATQEFYVVQDTIPPTVHWSSYLPWANGAAEGGEVSGANTPSSAPWLRDGASTSAPVSFGVYDNGTGVGELAVYANGDASGEPLFSADFVDGDEFLLSELTLAADATGYLLNVADEAGNTTGMYFNLDRSEPVVSVSSIVVHQLGGVYGADVYGAASDASGGIDGGVDIEPGAVAVSASEPAVMWPPGPHSVPYQLTGLQPATESGISSGESALEYTVSARDRAGFAGGINIGMSETRRSEDLQNADWGMSMLPAILAKASMTVTREEMPVGCHWVTEPGSLTVVVTTRSASTTEQSEAANWDSMSTGMSTDFQVAALPYTLFDVNAAGAYSVTPQVALPRFIKSVMNNPALPYECDGSTDVYYESAYIVSSATAAVTGGAVEVHSGASEWVSPGENAGLGFGNATVMLHDVSAGGRLQIVRSTGYPEVSGYHVVSGGTWEIKVSAVYSSLELKVCLGSSTLSAGQIAGAELYHYDNAMSMWEKITSAHAQECVSGVSSSASPFALLVPMDDATAPQTTIGYTRGGQSIIGGILYFSSSTYVNYYASDPGPEGDISGVDKIYSVIDVQPTQECHATPYDPSAPLGSCANSVYKGPFNVAEGVHRLYYLSIDKAGNAEQPKSQDAYVDGTPPVVALQAGAAYVVSGGSVTISVGDTVNISGSDPVSNGVASGIKMMYKLVDVTPAECLSADPPQACSGGVYSGPFALAVGTHTVYYEAVDKVGNESAIGIAYVNVLNIGVENSAAMAPSSGPIGVPFSIGGSGFGEYASGITTVLIGGATAPLTLWSTDTIKGTIPGSLSAGEYPVSVMRGTTTLANVSSFTVATPALYGLTPSSGPIGMPFTITGAGFGNYSSAYTHVLVGDTTAPLTLWADGKIQGTVPGGLSAGQYPVIVERLTADGGRLRTSSMTFEVVTVDVASMTPVAGPIGVPFTVYGAGFGNYVSGKTRVLLGDTTAPLTLWTDTSIQGTVPGSLAAGDYALVVERELNSGIARSSTFTFTVVELSVASMTPVAGPIGMPFTIYGGNFGNYSSGYTKVLLGDTTCPLTLWSDAKIQGTIPGSLADGDYAVTVVRSINGGLVQSSSMTFTVASPVAYALSPSSGPIGLPFSITGDNFGNYVSGYTRVLLGGATCPLTLWSTTTIKGTVPALAAGDYELYVERAINNGVVRSSTFSFTVADPALVSVTPATAAVVAAFTLGGYNFGNYASGYSRVLINGTTCPLTLWSDTKVQGKLPYLTAGTYPVQVQRAFNGGLAESATAYINVEEPYISSMTPVSGTAGSTYNLYGHGFGAYESSIAKVFVGGVASTLSLWTDTRITGTIPSGLSYGTYTVVAVRSQAQSDGVEYTIPGGFRVTAAGSYAPLSQEFKLGEVYVYPDPAKGGKVPTFHIEVGTADTVKIKVFTVSGDVVLERTLMGNPQVTGSVYAYEYPWEGRIASGVYYYTMEAERAGKKLKARGKFSVVR